MGRSLADLFRDMLARTVILLISCYRIMLYEFGLHKRMVLHPGPGLEVRMSLG